VLASIKRILPLVASVAVILAVGGCDIETDVPTPNPTATFPLPPPPTVSGPVPVVSSTFAPLPPLPLPERPYSVARRFIDAQHDDRPLRTMVLFPAGDFVDGAFDVAEGRFPLILFSHGLQGAPEFYESSLTRIAEAGFVVVAPTYPHTSAAAEEYDPLDVLNQPADASAVITAVLALAQDPADRLAGHLDPDRIAAMGHSAGGYTTAGLLSGDRDERIRAGVILAGSALRGAFDGPAAAVLFVHGEDDTVVPYDYGRATYGLVPWPKAFLTVVGGGHAEYLSGGPANAAVSQTVLDFLRATLYGDPGALQRIPADATAGGVTRFESTIIFPTPTPTAPASSTPTPTASPTLSVSASAAP
jgi:dienelactone hydrolase